MEYAPHPLLPCPRSRGRRRGRSHRLRRPGVEHAYREPVRPVAGRLRHRVTVLVVHDARPHDRQRVTQERLTIGVAELERPNRLRGGDEPGTNPDDDAELARANENRLEQLAMPRPRAGDQLPCSGDHLEPIDVVCLGPEVLARSSETADAERAADRQVRVIVVDGRHLTRLQRPQRERRPHRSGADVGPPALQASDVAQGGQVDGHTTIDECLTVVGVRLAFGTAAALAVHGHRDLVTSAVANDLLHVGDRAWPEHRQRFPVHDSTEILGEALGGKSQRPVQVRDLLDQICASAPAGPHARLGVPADHGGAGSGSKAREYCAARN